jgi:TPR repeat protein
MSSAAAAVLSAVSKLDPTGIASKVVDIATLIHGKYEQMNENKETCAGLNKQISIIGLIVKDLSKTKQIDYCTKTLHEVHECLTNCLKLIDSITATKKGFFSKVKDFLSSDSNKGLIAKLTTQLHDMADILNLALTAQTSQNVQQVMKLINEKQAEKLPEIQKLNKELEKNVDTFVKNISQVINVSSNSSSSSISNNAVNVVINSPTASSHQDGRDSPPLETRFQKIEEEKKLYVLKRLKELFRDRDKGEKSRNFQTYNDVLESYGAELGYKDGQHTLYMNDEPVSSANALKEITKLINTIQTTLKSTSPQSISSNPSKAPTPTSQMDAKDRKDTQVKNQPMVTAFNQLKLTTSSPQSTATAASSSFGLESYLKAANQGDITAQYTLANKYYFGDGITKDLKQAAEWYQKAAHQGNARAQSTLVMMYLNGEGVTKDLNKAFEWCQKAANQGDAGEQHHLAGMYKLGTGVTKDLKRAAEWYQKSADQGNVRAQRDLAYMYQYGDGDVTKDLKKAAELYQKAADQGDDISKDIVKRMQTQLKPR